MLYLRVLFLSSLLLFVSGCDVSSDDDDDNSNPEVAGDGSTPAFTSRCGTVTNGGELDLGVSSGQARAVSVSSTSSDSAVVTYLDGENAGLSEPVKFHGVVARNKNSQRGVNLIAQGSSPNAYFVPAGAECIHTFSNGAQGPLGQLYTAAGQNMNELLIEMREVVPQSSGSCGASTLATCYDGIAPTVSSKVINWFLWKPVSESNGAIAILVNPTDVLVRVEGAITQDLNDTGPSNGRGTTARGTASGCSFGSNVKVTFRDANDGSDILLSDGRTEVIIPNGCDRVEFRL